MAIRCPTCKRRLIPKEGKLVCAYCGKEYEYNRGFMVYKGEIVEWTLDKSVFPALILKFWGKPKGVRRSQ